MNRLQLRAPRGATGYLQYVIRVLFSEYVETGRGGQVEKITDRLYSFSCEPCSFSFVMQCTRPNERRKLYDTTNLRNVPNSHKDMMQQQIDDWCELDKSSVVLTTRHTDQTIYVTIANDNGKEYKQDYTKVFQHGELGDTKLKVEFEKFMQEHIKKEAKWPTSTSIVTRQE